MFPVTIPRVPFVRTTDGAKESVVVGSSVGAEVVVEEVTVEAVEERGRVVVVGEAVERVEVSLVEVRLEVGLVEVTVEKDLVEVLEELSFDVVRVEVGLVEVRAELSLVEERVEVGLIDEVVAAAAFAVVFAFTLTHCRFVQVYPLKHPVVAISLVASPSSEGELTESTRRRGDADSGRVGRKNVGALAHIADVRFTCFSRGIEVVTRDADYEKGQLRPKEGDGRTDRRCKRATNRWPSGWRGEECRRIDLSTCRRFA